MGHNTKVLKSTPDPKKPNKPKDIVVGNSSTEDWLNEFDTDEERSREGYKDTSRFRNEPYNDIYTPNGMIDMSETGIPLMANGQYLPPYSGITDMGTPYVREVPFGGQNTKTHTHMAEGGWLDTMAKGGIAEEAPILEVPIEEVPNIGTPVDPPVATPTANNISKKQAYQDAIKNNYAKYIESVHNITPYAESTSKEHMNCIHGVCTVIQGTGAKKFNQSYTGNMTFADNAKKEGYYKADPNKEGFEIGDVIQYARTKSHAATMGRFTPSSTLNSVNANELVPQHAKVILDKYVDDDGVTRYKVGHNGGKDKWILSGDPDDETKDLAETTLLKHFNEGWEKGDTYFDGLIVNRYDPDYVQKTEEKDKLETDAIKGKNQYANAYKGQPEIDIKQEVYDMYGKPLVTDYTKAKPLLDFYKKNYEKIGKSADMPPATLNKLFHNQIGIAAQETEFDDPLTKRAITKSLVPDWALSGARRVAGMINDDTTWVDDYWKKNADDVQKKYKTVDEFKKHLGENSKLSPEGREYLYYNSPKSKGMFQQKELSKRGRMLGSNFDTPENQFVSSMHLAVDNYHLLKNKYPDLSDDQLVDLTTLMHNAPSKALTPEFVNYYLKNNDIQYVNDVKNKRGVINQPDNIVKKVQKIQDHKSLNKLSPQELNDVTNWAKNLSKKAFGGETNWLEEYDIPKAQDGLNKRYPINVDDQSTDPRKYSFNNPPPRPGPLAFVYPDTYKDNQIAKQNIQESVKEKTQEPTQEFEKKSVQEPVKQNKKPVKTQDVVKERYQAFFPNPANLSDKPVSATPTYYGGKEQNMSQYPMTTAQKLIYKAKKAAEIENDYNAAKQSLNVAGFIPGPYGLGANILAGTVDIAEGDYGQGIVQGAATVLRNTSGKKAQAIKGLSNLITGKEIYDYGTTPEKTYIDMLPYYTDKYKRELFKPQSLTSQKYGGQKRNKGLPKKTTKNPVKGINKLFATNQKLFGPSGRSAFDPNSKFENGGWLNEYEPGGVLPKSDSKNYYTSNLNDYLYRRKMYDDSLTLNKYSDAQLKKWIDIGKGELRVRAPLNVYNEHEKEGNWSPNIKSGDLITDYYNNKIQPSAQYDFSGEQKYQNINNLYKKPTQQVYYVQPSLNKPQPKPKPKTKIKEQSRTDVYTDKALYDKAHKAEMDSIMAQGYKDIYKQTWRNLLNAKNETDAIKAADNFKNNYFQKADASPETKALLNQQQRYPVDPEFMEGLIWKTTKEIPWDNVGVSTEDPPRLSPNLYPRVHNIYVPPKPNTQPEPATLKSKPKPKLIEKKKPEIITPEHLPMIEANMPEMRSQEPEITPNFTFPKQSNVNNRIGWRMDLETRKMVPVYLEGKQKVAQGKRLYNQNIPTSTMAIPEDFEPQFNRPESFEKTDPYWRRKYVQPKTVANKKYGGWLDNYE